MKVEIPCHDIHYPLSPCNKIHYFDRETKEYSEEERAKFTTDSQIVNPGELED